MGAPSKRPAKAQLKSPARLVADFINTIDPSATSDTVYCSLMEIFTGFLSVARLQNPPAIGRG
jgi:hypothetical protein